MSILSSTAGPRRKPDTRVRPLVAWRAVQRLLKDPEATGEVFKIIEALKGDSLEKATYKLRASDKGRALLRAKPDIVRALEDREALAAMPEGSLGRAYLHFVESENLSAQGLMDASAEAPRTELDPDSVFYDPDQIWLGARMRDIHDLYHVITGYGRDPLGEICVISFSNAQSHNRGIAFVVYMAQRKSAKSGPGPTMRDCVSEAKTNGAHAHWFAEQNWEELLALPLDDVRTRFGVRAPGLYNEVLGEASYGCDYREEIADIAA